ncbi:glycoside hydrolase family 28 protein [Moniliophthora roreri MCA 2997]|uniref:galacturonan 1,4-alpha-galacturonidase n=1 Tax=Moniliophthora roreri (strain MCA 2997) TaxID=1381753 RepID=V2XF81_MONRO|nr:glycoside hydrolase family 28 protein [Moniliophthora roreri MCA 2997]
MRYPGLLVIISVLFQLAAAWKTFVVPHTPGQDDTPALVSGLANYTSDSTILFEKGKTYNILTPVTFPTLTNVEVRIEGNITLPDDMPTVQAIVASSDFSGHWFFFNGGTNVTLRGSKDHKWGWVDAHGQSWWDAQEQNNRPHGWRFNKIDGGVITDMKLWKPIAWSFSTSGSNNLHAYNNRIFAMSNSNSFPFNTDGFSAGGTNMLFEDNFIQNGDDCITVGNGAKNIHFRNSYCEGGHGLSIGSLGKDGQVADVQNVLIENVVMVNSLYGARFKSWTGGNGLARNITWRNIAVRDVPFPVGPRPNSTSLNNTHIQDFLFENFHGDVKDVPYVEGSCVSDPCWYTVPGATGKEVVIYDLYPDTATNIRVKNINIRTQTGAKAMAMCDPNAVSFFFIFAACT